MIRDDLIRRIDAVQTEFGVSRHALTELTISVGRNPTPLRRQGLRPRDVAACLRHLEPTYIVRAFAEFDMSVRHVHRKVRRRPALSRGHVVDLMDWLASHFYMTYAVAASADDVRAYRNSIVHEGNPATPLTLGQCCSHLRRFLGWLPHKL